MKTSRYSDSQVLAILKQAESGGPLQALCREHGMSSATFNRERATFWWCGCLDDEAHEGTGRRNPAAEEDVC